MVLSYPALLGCFRRPRRMGRIPVVLSTHRAFQKKWQRRHQLSYEGGGWSSLTLRPAVWCLSPRDACTDPFLIPPSLALHQPAIWDESGMTGRTDKLHRRRIQTLPQQKARPSPSDSAMRLSASPQRSYARDQRAMFPTSTGRGPRTYLTHSLGPRTQRHPANTSQVEPQAPGIHATRDVPPASRAQPSMPDWAAIDESPDRGLAQPRAPTAPTAQSTRPRGLVTIVGIAKLRQMPRGWTSIRLASCKWL